MCAPGRATAPPHHLFGALTLLRENLILLYEHKGNTLNQRHSIHHRKTPVYSELLLNQACRPDTSGNGTEKYPNRSPRTLCHNALATEKIDSLAGGPFPVTPSHGWRASVCFLWQRRVQRPLGARPPKKERVIVPLADTSHIAYLSSKWRSAYVIDCIEIDTDVNYCHKHNKPQKNCYSAKFVFHNWVSLHEITVSAPSALLLLLKVTANQVTKNSRSGAFFSFGLTL